jgi:arsenate reductase
MEAPERPSVLFLCTGNSCRSQMAEAWLRHLTAGRVVALSAGTNPVGINPRAVAVMEEVGIDLGGHSSDSIEDYLADPPDVVIAVCSNAAETCPTFPGATIVLRWPFDDPAHFEGTDEEVLPEFRRVRDEIKARIEEWLDAGLPPLGEG